MECWGNSSYTLRSFKIEEHTNPYSFLKRIASEFNLELQFRIAIENGKVVRYVDMIERIGRWRGFEVTFGQNLLGIERKSKSTNVVTALLGVSPPDIDGNVKTTLIEDQDALKRWGVPDGNGNLQHLYAVYHPQSSDQNMTQERLDTLTENELEKRVNATIEYNTDIATLSNKLGQQVFIGDTVRVKDEKFTPALYLEARVHTSEGSIKENARTKIVLGDYIEFTQEEVMSIWRGLQKQIAFNWSR
ncbi:phage tail spike protein [Piscibacillus salipiscarius]|uniref:phage tail spike protein n=1 Tax=Piscibacillus salipiscarius TaxID=299480 RepID=UPI0006D0A3AC|nr:phage tail spike protein [Piscibacillus salipiscarius]